MNMLKKFLLVGLCAGGTASLSLSAAAPDLVVLGVTSPHLDGGVVKVRVKNHGNAEAAKDLSNICPQRPQRP